MPLASDGNGIDGLLTQPDNDDQSNQHQTNDQTDHGFKRYVL